MTDKRLMICDTLTGKTQKTVDIGSQICNVFWNKEYKEIVTTTGTSSNEISLWNDTTLKNVASINNHHDRILYSVMTPDNNNIITITTNDPLRLWNLFPKKPTLLSLR